MKILFCTHTMNNGGAERVVSLWMKGFYLQGYEVALVLCTKNEHRDYKIIDSHKIFNIYTLKNNRLATFITRITKLRKIIKSEKPDIIITALGPWGLWAYIASLGLHKRIINTEHNSFERPESAPMTKSTYFYKYIVNKLFSDITVLTMADKIFIGDRLNNVKVLPNPLAYESVLSKPIKDKIILAAGRLDAWHVKGFDILMKAWNIVSPQYPEWELVIAGRGSNKSLTFLQEMLDEEPSKRVKFLGFVSDIVAQYRKSSIFVLSSRYEGFGMVLVEAMSQGCACVTTDFNGRQKEIINESKYGLICSPDNVEALAENLSILISNDNLRSQIQDSCIERSKDFSLNKIMVKWNKIINKK